MKRIPEGGLDGAALREATSEFNQLTELVSAALRTHLALGRDEWVWPSHMYADRIVVRRNGKLLQFPYTVGDDNRVTFGDSVEVTLEPTPVAKPAATMTEAKLTIGGGNDDGMSWLVEAKRDAADKPPRYHVRVIKSGISKNNVDYPAKVLREATPLFEGARVFVKSDEDHIKGKGKSVSQLVGKLTEPRFVETTKGSGEIQAVMDIFESEPVAEKLREAVERNMTSLFGLSIDASGKTKTTGQLREATRIDRVASVDLIIDPGAGGEILRFAEAFQEPNSMLRDQMLDQIRTRDPARADALANAGDDAVLAAFKEAVQTAPAGGSGDGASTGLTQTDVQAQIRLAEARGDAKARVAASKLPQPAKDRLTARFAEATTIADLATDKVDAAIAAEQDYGRAFRESAPISGLGAAEVQGETRAQAIGRMLDKFFSGKGTMSFKECYIEITGDRKVSGQIKDMDLGRLAEAAGTFREAISSSTFSSILGDSIARRMQEAYTQHPQYDDWRDLCDVVPISDFRTQERAKMGGYGNLPAVAQAGAYTALTSPTDFKSTYAVTKRGGLETLTLEAIANDDVGLIQRIPIELANAAATTLYEFVLDFLSTNPVIYDGLALFVGGHNNLGVAALDATSYAAARLRMQKQTKLSSGKRLGLNMRHIYIPHELEQTAYDLFVRNTNQDKTFVQSQNPKVHVVPHWTDVNNWYGTADKTQIRLIELGFLNGQQEPELFVQDNPSVGSLFTNDQITYKIRHIYGGAPTDFRGFDGSVVP